MAFTHTRQARHPHTVPKERKCLTTLQTSRNAADRSVVPPRFAPGLSATHGVSLTGTLVSPRTGLTPAGCPELVAQLRHNNLLAVMAPELLGAPRDRHLLIGSVRSGLPGSACSDRCQPI